MERSDYVNDSLKLIQNTDGLTFGTDALLLAGYISGKKGRGCELGAGSGIISMLLAVREKIREADALEIQEKYAELCKRNFEQNGLSERLHAQHADVRAFGISGAYDTVYTNPPYMKADSGFPNEKDEKNIARHEIEGDIYDFCRAAKRLLRFGGSFYAVYRPDRLTDLIHAMRECRLEPKRATFVHADTESESSMVLIEARSGGRSGMKLTCPFIIYSDKTHKEYSDDMRYLDKEGSFPVRFGR